jgi:hypothetical protein
MLLATSFSRSNNHVTATIAQAARRWRSCRQILLFLIAMHALILVYIGISVSKLPQSIHPLMQERGEHQLSSAAATTNPAPVVSLVEEAEKFNVPKSHESRIPVKVEEVAVAATNGGLLHVTEAFFADFRQQRAQPNFRSAALPGPDKWIKRQAFLSEQQHQQGITNHSLKACYYYGHGRLLIHPQCQPDADGKHPAVVVYNSLEGIDRTWCGQTIRPLGFHRMEGGCTEPVKVFPHDFPPVLGTGMPPIQFIRKDSPAAALQTLDSCSINCEVTTDRCKGAKSTTSSELTETIDCFPMVSDWTIGNTTWNFSIYHRDPNIKFDRKAYRNFHFSASPSPKADVPLSLFRWDRDGGTPTPALDFDVVDKSVSFFDDTACRGHTHAASWVQTFKERAKLASYGNCIPTTPIPPGLSMRNEADRLTLLEKHLFHFVADHATADEFACGAVWDALHAGAIPVYYGPNNISQYVPPHSIISASEIGTKEGAADLIMEIASNRTLWETYHAWRKQPFPRHLKQKLELVPTEPLLCRICKWAYAKRYGLAWNPTTQQVQMPVIARDYVCQSGDGLVMQPFRESWIFSSSSSSQDDVTLRAAGMRCADSTKLTQVFQSDGLFSLTRTMSQHDTIVDFIIPEIKSQKGKIVLRLDVPIENWEGSHFRDIHQSIASDHVSFHSSAAIQDRTSRMTVLANWPTQLRSPAQGIVEIVVLGSDEESLLTNEIRQIRILLEDISSLRDVKTEYGATPFAKPLIQDFLDPLELYSIV